MLDLRRRAAEADEHPAPRHGHIEPVAAEPRRDGGDARRRGAEACGELSGREVLVEERRVLVRDSGDEVRQSDLAARAEDDGARHGRICAQSAEITSRMG